MHLHSHRHCSITGLLESGKQQKYCRLFIYFFFSVHFIVKVKNLKFVKNIGIIKIAYNPEEQNQGFNHFFQLTMHFKWVLHF